MTNILASTTLESTTADETISGDPLGFDAARSMAAGVIRDRHQLQVCKSVVRLDPIDVVDVFATSKAATKMLFHDEIVLKAILTEPRIDSDVSRTEDVSTTSPVRVPFAGSTTGGVTACP
jgi:hypothetical protein